MSSIPKSFVNGEMPSIPKSFVNGEMPSIPKSFVNGEMPSIPKSFVNGEMPSIPKSFMNNNNNRGFSLDSLEDFPLPSSSSPDYTALINIFVDWKNTADGHILKVDLPGLVKEEVKVEIEDDLFLIISGERSFDIRGDGGVERISDTFSRKFRLGRNARMDQARASMEYGVLTVVIPKEAKNPKRRSIQISGWTNSST